RKGPRKTCARRNGWPGRWCLKKGRFKARSPARTAVTWLSLQSWITKWTGSPITSRRSCAWRDMGKRKVNRKGIVQTEATRPESELTSRLEGKGKLRRENHTDNSN